MNAETLARALGGRKAGYGWMACCPAHEDREPSLSICDAVAGKVLVRCFAGCDQAQVIAALRAQGLWSGNCHRRIARPVQLTVAKNQPDEAKRSDAALAIWRSAMPAGGTLVETYLASRGLNIRPPPALRFHVGLTHPMGGVWPAMVALVTRGPPTISGPIPAP